MYPARLVSPYTGPHVHALATYQPRIVYTCARPSARGCAGVLPAAHRMHVRAPLRTWRPVEIHDISPQKWLSRTYT